MFTKIYNFFDNYSPLIFCLFSLLIAFLLCFGFLLGLIEFVIGILILLLKRNIILYLILVDNSIISFIVGRINNEKRYWAFVLYPESAPENWKDILQETGLSCCVSPLHDKDTNPTGEAKRLTIM